MITPILNKKEKIHCARCTKKVRLRCPICLLDTIPRNCKVRKSPSSLHAHLQREHRDFENYYFSVRDIIDSLNGIAFALETGMMPN